MGVQRKVLFFASGESVAKTRKLVLETAGYPVTVVKTCEEAVQALQRPFQAFLIGARLSKETAECAVKAAHAAKVPTILISNEYAARADIVLPSMARPERLLEAVGEAVIRQHGHEVPDHGCFLFVDTERRYLHVTSGAADMLGFERTELIGRRIDDISAPEMAVENKFEQYVRDGMQCGSYVLMRRDGSPLQIAYQARVLPDGCMVSEISAVRHG